MADLPENLSPEELIEYLTRQPEKGGAGGYVGDEVDAELERQIDAAQRGVYGMVTKTAPATDDIGELQDFAAHVTAADALGPTIGVPVDYHAQLEEDGAVEPGYSPDIEDEILAQMERPEGPQPDPGDPETVLRRPTDFSTVAIARRPEARPVERSPFQWSLPRLKAAALASQRISTGRMVEILRRKHPEVTTDQVLEWKQSPIFQRRVDLLTDKVRFEALMLLVGNAMMVARMHIAIIKSGTKNDDTKLRAIKLYYDVTGIAWNQLLADKDDERGASSVAGFVEWLDGEFREVLDRERDPDPAWVGREAGPEALAATIDAWEDTRREDAILLNQRIKVDPKSRARDVSDQVGDLLRPEGGSLDRRGDGDFAGGVGPAFIDDPEQDGSSFATADWGDVLGHQIDRFAASLDVPLELPEPIDVEPVDPDAEWEDAEEIEPAEVVIQTLGTFGPSDPTVQYLKQRLSESKWLILRRLDEDYDAEYQRRRRERSEREGRETKRRVLIAR